MTAEEIKKEIARIQDVTKDIKVSVGNLRTDINRLEGAIKQDNDEFEARLAEAESRGFQKGYEKGFAEGCKRGADDTEIRVGDEVIAVLTDKRGTAVVINIDNKHARYIYADGSTGWDGLSELKKTGRHFTEVEKLLEAMKG